MKKKIVSTILAFILLNCTMGVPAFATDETPCYLFEDFEADDFINTAESTTPPAHSGGSTEKWEVADGCDSTSAIVTEANGNTYLQYRSVGSGKEGHNTMLNLTSETVKSSAGNRIYDYTVSYDMKIDDWTKLDTEGNEVDHISRYMHILHGSANTATAKIYNGYLHVCTADGGSIGVGKDGLLQPLVSLWDTATGVGDWHNLRFTYSKGADGAGYVDVYVDGICVVDNGIYAEEAVSLPVNGELYAGRYFAVRAEDREEPYGAMRSKIRFDNIKLEYEGAPLSETRDYGDGALRVLNGRINTEQSLSGSTVSFDHVYRYTVENNGAAETMKAILATYSDAGVLTSCSVSETQIPAGAVKDGSVVLKGSADISQTEGYTVKGYLWTEDYKPRYDVLGFRKTGLDWALMEMEALYDGERMIDWLVSLYDMQSGGMYYATSSKQNPHLFGPHIESTYGGMYSAIPYLNSAAKAALGKWIQSCQDPGTGYFVEKEFSINSVNQSKKGRDLGYAKGLLSAVGMQPLYPTPDQRQAVMAANDMPTLMASDGTLTGSLGSWADWKSYLDSQSWSDSNVWGTCHSLESNAGLIVNAGYKKQTAEYIAAKVNPQTGMLGQSLSYNTMSGTLKALWAFGSDSIPYPYVDKLFENALTLAQKEAPGDMAQLINLPVGMQGAKNSYAAAGVPLPAGVNETLKEITPDLIRVLTKELAKFKKPDGCFGYSKTGGQAYSQGAHVSLGLNESDINGNNALALRVRSVLYEFAGKVATNLLPPQVLAARINALWEDNTRRTATETQGFTIGEKGAMSPESVWTLSIVK